jgi:ABC-type glutathione transport system ATPase component
MELRRRGKPFTIEDLNGDIDALLSVRVQSPDGDVIRFSVHEGQCVWLRGNSGVGKSSIARVIAGIDAQTPFDTQASELCE